MATASQYCMIAPVSGDLCVERGGWVGWEGGGGGGEGKLIVQK